MFGFAKNQIFCFVLVFIGSNAGASYLEAAAKPKVSMNIVHSFSDMLKPLAKEKEEESTLICIDVDRVFLQHEHLGNPAWFEKTFRKFAQSFSNEQKARDRAEQQLIAIDSFKRRKCLEPSLPDIFAEISGYSCKLLGVSSCKAGAALALVNNLLFYGLDFSFSSPFAEDFLLENSVPLRTPFVYRGILFCCSSSIEKTLLELFSCKGILPRKVIFISDSPDLVKAVGFACTKQKMEFLGLVYYPASESLFTYTHPFSSAAELQEKQALTLVSDEMAQRVLNLRPS